MRTCIPDQMIKHQPQRILRQRHHPILRDIDVRGHIRQQRLSANARVLGQCQCALGIQQKRHAVCGPCDPAQQNVTYRRW